MGKVTRKRYAAEFKSRVALEAIRGELTLAELALKHGLHQTMIAHYNERRPHTALAGRTPDEAYHNVPTPSGPGLTPDQMANSNAVRRAA